MAATAKELDRDPELGVPVTPGRDCAVTASRLSVRHHDIIFVDHHHGRGERLGCPMRYRFRNVRKWYGLHHR